MQKKKELKIRIKINKNRYEELSKCKETDKEKVNKNLKEYKNNLKKNRKRKKRGKKR